MALKHKITDAEFKKLDKLIQAEYKKGEEDGEYVLDVDGLEDTGALKRAKEHEAEKRKEAQKALKDLQAKLDETNTELETVRSERAKGGDKVAETEKAWKDKLAKREAELQKEIDATQKALQTQMVDNVALAMATDLAGENAEILLPHITRRLTAEVKDGKASTKVLGPDGEVSAITPDELKKEILSSGKFAAVVVASKGSGAGGSGPRKGAGGSNTPKKLSEMSATEEASFARENPEKYREMAAAEPVRFPAPTVPGKGATVSRT